MMDMSSMAGHVHHDAPAEQMAGHVHHDDPAKQSEHNALLDLVKPENTTHVAVNSGSWFDLNTWGNGQVPDSYASVYIPPDIVVSYDDISDDKIFTLRVDGQLDFATDVDTQMIVDTFVVSPTGSLTIGTEESPVRHDVQTKIIIADNGAIDTTWDPQQLSRGLISHGTVEIHGQSKTSHLKVDVDPAAGDTVLELGEVPVNWQVGDRIILTGTQYVVDGSQDEVRTITAIDGNRITLDQSLTYNHTTPRSDLKAYVANQSRNIVITSENADTLPANQRGHVMFMHSDDVDVRYAEFRGLGRTDKSRLLDDFLLTDSHAPRRVLDEEGNPIAGARTNIRGRYPLHLHRTGVHGGEQPAILVGNSVVDAPGWGIVHHDGYAVLENNLTYDVFGSGFVNETGNEIGAWRNNISIKNDGRDNNEKNGTYNQDLGFGGHGFWFQSRLVENEGNVAAGSHGSGVFYFHRGVDQIKPLTENLALESWGKGVDEVETSDSPIIGFKDNEVLASANGLTVIKNSQVQHHDGRTILDGFIAWDVAHGVELQYTAHYTINDFDLIGTNTPLHRNALNDGLHLFHNVEEMVFNNLKAEGFENGVRLDKEIAVGEVLDDWGFVFIDEQVQNNTTDWVNLDTEIDRVLTSTELQPGELSFELDEAASDLVASNGDQRVPEAVTIFGTKTDSLGTIALPFGNETLGYTLHQLRSLAKDRGYYTLADGRQGIVVDEYISDRVTGDVRLYQFFVEFASDTNWLRNDKAPHLGLLDLSTLEQGGQIIPATELTNTYPKFLEETSELSGRVFLDSDGDGIRDIKESAIEGITVTLTETGADGLMGTDDDTHTTQVTNINGQYRFTNLSAGDYKVTFSDLPDNHEFTLSNQGSSLRDSDVDPTTGMTQIINLGSGEVNSATDVGVRDIAADSLVNKAALGNTVFFDANGNGIHDSGEVGVEGITVTLTGAGEDNQIGTADDTTATEVTNAQGIYIFTNLAANNYIASFSDLPEGLTFTTANVGTNDTLDSDVAPTTGVSQVITLEDGELNLTTDAGLKEIPVTTSKLGNLVFLDTDGDGIKDSGETGVARVTVTLTGAGADNVFDTDDDITATKVTGTTGYYQFQNLAAGDYTLAFSDLPEGFEFTTANAGTNDNRDSDADPITGITEVITLGEDEKNFTIDVGLRSAVTSPPTVTTSRLGNLVFLDTDGDGIKDNGETGVAGVTVTLTGVGADNVLGTDDDITATKVTGATGYYQFQNLAAGDYTLAFSDLPEGFEFTTANAGTNDNRDSDADPITGITEIITLGEDEKNFTIDVGLRTDVIAPSTATSKLGNLVFLDANGNGIKDNGEAGVAGVTVTLTGAGADSLPGTDDDTTATKVTGATGYYQFQNLAAGDYMLTFADLPEGFEFTTANAGTNDNRDSDVDAATGMTQVISLGAGERNMSIDVGLIQAAPITSIANDDIIIEELLTN